MIYGFNEECKNIAVSYMNVGYEFMSVIRFWATVKGDLPHLYYIFRKTEPLGAEFKTVACSVTGGFLFVDVEI